MNREERTIRQFALLAAFIVLLFCSAPESLAQAEQVQRIEVKSVWRGLAPYSESKLAIRRKKDGFYREGKRLGKELIESLLREIHEQAEAPTLENLGVSESWLRQMSTGVLPSRLKKAEQSEKDLFLNSYQNINLIEKLLPQFLRGGWTDDYPNITLTILKNDGSEVRVESDRQNVFMIPFAIVEGGNTRYSYNANLARAIAALLPEDFTNRERLAGELLQHVISERVMIEIEDELSRLETKNKIGTELQRLEGRYSLKKTSFGYISSVDVETMGEKFPRWNAELYRVDLPKNIFIGVSLPFENGRLKNFDLFISRIDSLVERAVSVPWLAKYLAEHADTKMEVRFVTNNSMSPKAVEYFVETMKSLGAESIASDVQGQLAESVFLQVKEEGGWSRWIVLPDGRMILFDFQGDTVLKWRLEDFTTRVRFNTKFWHMAKAVISPRGEILSN